MYSRAAEAAEPSDTNLDLMPNNQTDAAYLRISLRQSNSTRTNKESSAPSSGSVNIFLFANGLVKVYVGDKLEQEATLQVASNYEYLITDVGEHKPIHIDLSSLDDTTNKYSIELLVDATQYASGQEYFVEQCLLSDVYVVGIDVLHIYNEISDPLEKLDNKNLI